MKGAPGVYYSEDVKGRKRFEVRYVTSDGRRAYEVVGNRLDAAKARAAEMSVKKYKGEAVASPSTTVSDLIEGYRRVRAVKPRTVSMQEQNIRLHILPRWGKVRARDVTKVGIQEWLLGLDLAESTKSLVFRIFSIILEYGIDANVIAVNPAKALSGKAKPKQGTMVARILQPGEQAELLEACDRTPWLRDLILASLYGALRLGEVVGLKWEDVDFEHDKLIIQRTLGQEGFGSPKGGVSEEIPLMPELRKILTRLYLAAEDKSPNGAVFYNGHGQHRQPRDVQRAFSNARQRAGLSTEPRVLRFHDLRHTSISRLANAPGAVLPQVQAFARHSSLATTLGYVHRIENAKWAESAAVALTGL